MFDFIVPFIVIIVIMDVLGLREFLDHLFGLETEKKPEPIPEWAPDWQTRLAKRAKETEIALMTPEQRNARYMPEELRKKLGLT